MRFSVSQSLALALSIGSSFSFAQELGFEGVGADSFIWHGRYHGILAMAHYAPDKEAACADTFTTESMHSNFPELPIDTDTFEVVNEWGPTEKYGLSGYNVIVPEMNKIVMVVGDVYGWQDEVDDSMTHFEGIGCEDCMVHAGAYEAFREAQNETNDWIDLQGAQMNYVWSVSGFGFGGMVSQIAALDLKYREMVWSSKTMGSPPVFNAAAANMYDELFPSDSSQRYVHANDSVPAMIPVEGDSEYVFVNTGIHLFGRNPMYGMDYEICYSPRNPLCHGGDNEVDHYYYFTNVGTCAPEGYETFPDEEGNEEWLASLEEAHENGTTASMSSDEATSTASDAVNAASASAGERDDDLDSSASSSLSHLSAIAVGVTAAVFSACL